MSIKKRKTHQGDSYVVRVQVKGQRVKRSLGPGSTRTQARELETQLKRELIDGKVLSKQAERSLAEATTRWVEESGHLKWIKSAANHIEQIQDIIEDHALREAPEAAEKVKERAREKGWSAATTNRRLALIRRIANLAYKEWGWLDEPVGERVSMLRGEQSRHVYLSPEEVETIAQTCERQDAADMIRLAAWTGLRLSELVNLDPDENIKGGMIVLGTDTKNGKPRLVPIHEQARPALRSLPFKRSDRYLEQYWRKAANKAGYPHVRFHDLRHSYASWLAGAGVDPTAMRDLLGHSSLSVTSRYSHLHQDRLRQAVDQIGMNDEKGD